MVGARKTSCRGVIPTDFVCRYGLQNATMVCMTRCTGDKCELDTQVPQLLASLDKTREAICKIIVWFRLCSALGPPLRACSGRRPSGRVEVDDDTQEVCAERCSRSQGQPTLFLSSEHDERADQQMIMPWVTFQPVCNPSEVGSGDIMFKGRDAQILGPAGLAVEYRGATTDTHPAHPQVSGLAHKRSSCHFGAVCVQRTT